MFLNTLFVVIGGGIGSACRYLFSLLAVKWFGYNFPLGTLGVNLLGCFLIGLSFALADRNIISPTIRLSLVTGFLGGLTTFSAYALESANFIGGAGISAALSNIALNNLGGIALVFLGLWLGKAI